MSDGMNLDKKSKKRQRDEKNEIQEEKSSKAEIDENEDEKQETEEEKKIRKEAKKKRKAEKAAKKASETAVESINTNSSNSSSSSSTTTSNSSSTIRFNFYKPDSSILSMKQSDVDAFRTTHSISVANVNGDDIRPIQQFSQLSLSLPSEQMKILSSFEKPTPIQSQCWPIILSGRDIVAIAETGSGKTLGFVLPSLIHIFSQKPILTVSQAQSQSCFQEGAAGPIALVLSPTRELAQQTSVVCETASKQMNSLLKIACIYGGIEKRIQRESLKNGAHIVVACPGRLLSLIQENVLSIKRVTYMVLDEADRMLDMGFEPDIRAIMGHISIKRQTLMFSATWPTVIQKLASEFITNPVHVTIGRIDASELKANTRVKQTIQVMEDHEKQNRLISLLQQYCPAKNSKIDKENNRVIVFCLYKKEVDRIARFLEMKGFANVVLSGDRTQADRERAIADFKSGKARLLIATDVAARGLDVNDVEHVINYTFPLTVEDYIHRIGRTGRAGKTGNAYTFFTKAEKHLSGELINVLRESNENIPEELMNFGVFTKKKEHGMYGAFFKELPEGQVMKAPVRVKFD